MAGRDVSLRLRCVSFSHEGFVAEIRNACGGEDLGSEEQVPVQVRYLYSFLRKHPRKPRTLVIEEPYVDRHYMEEYAGYYAKALHPPSSKTTRIHVFSESFDLAGFEDRLRQAAEGAWSATVKALDRAYVGFVVVRPIPSAPVGRTVLAPYDEPDEPRHFEPAKSIHRVHLAGLELTVEGVPFQQQDQAVGACATTAVWSAIARVARADGSRAPTPLDVTLAATRHFLNDRPLRNCSPGGLKESEVA